MVCMLVGAFDKYNMQFVWLWFFFVWHSGIHPSPSPSPSRTKPITQGWRLSRARYDSYVEAGGIAMLQPRIPPNFRSNLQPPIKQSQQLVSIWIGGRQRRRRQAVSGHPKVYQSKVATLQHNLSHEIQHSGFHRPCCNWVHVGLYCLH